MAEPSAPRRSAGEWLFQLTTITIGVLIALSFDAVLRWNADRVLLAEATRTIAEEVANNRASIEQHIATLPAQFARFDSTLKLVDGLLAGVQPSDADMQVGVSMPELSDAGWQTAERAGALSLMPYADVQRLARLYAFQDLFERQEERMIEPISKLAAWFLGRDNPLSAPPKDLESLRAMMIDFRGALYQHQQLTEQLGAAYATYGNASP